MFKIDYVNARNLAGLGRSYIETVPQVGELLFFNIERTYYTAFKVKAVEYASGSLKNLDDRGGLEGLFPNVKVLLEQVTAPNRRSTQNLL